MAEDFIEGDEPTPDARPRRLSLRGKSWRWVLLAVVVFVLLYYPLGALWAEHIDDSIAVQPEKGGSQAVGIATALIDREINQHSWVSSDPFFLPGYILDNMPNFQQGLMSALARFTLELTDQIGRTRGSSRADPDADQAAGLLKYPANVFLWNTNVSLLPTASSEAQYRAALGALRRYNLRVSQGQAVFERRADNLRGALERIAADLGSSSALLEQRINEHAGDWWDFQADDIFYNVKGRMYAYGLLLRGLGEDYKAIIETKEMRAAWDQTVDSLLRGAAVHPLIVVNGATGAFLTPNHLANLGFFLLRARTQLREITAILQD
ncbi:MAG TPA: DUF2333 family protein [Dongiaceae bacterium]|jgi:hypothetical protein|nr:DUF2333 family protein [Dongiaceae bacterium]